MREFMKIVEGFGTYTEIEFVCINPENGGSDPEKVKTLYKMLSQLPGLVLMRQDFMEEAGHLAFVAIIVESGEVSERDVVAAAKRAGVAIDTTRQIDDRILDQIYDGSYPDMIDMLATSTGFTCRGRSWSDHHATSKVAENELNEVKMIDDFGDDGYQMERVFNRWTAQGADGKVVGNINGYDIHEKDGGTGRTFLFLFKDGECAGRATVDIARGMENTVKMAHIVIHPDLRRKGLGIGLYEYVLQSNDIVSDYDQTRFGRAIWQELARRHVVRPLEIDGSLSAPITNTDQVYGTHTRLVASLR